MKLKNINVNLTVFIFPFFFAVPQIDIRWLLCIGLLG